MRPLGNHVEPPLRGELGPTLGNQATIRRSDAGGDLTHFRGGRHLEVHAGGEDAAQELHVPRLDMAPVFSQMQGDEIRPRLLRDQGRLDGLGIAGPPGLADGGDVVDVDPE